MRVRYGAKYTCAKFGKEARYNRVKNRRSYEREFCGYQVYPTAGTPFHGTRTSLRDWFYVIFLFTSTRNGVAAKRVSARSADLQDRLADVCHLIRHHMGHVDGDGALGGLDGKPVEIDHGFICGYDRLGESDKKVVLGMVDQGGNVVARHLRNRSSSLVHKTIQTHIKPGSHIVSDSEHTFGGIPMMGRTYQHTMVNTRANAFKKQGQTTNTIEGFWGCASGASTGRISASRTSTCSRIRASSSSATTWPPAAHDLRPAAAVVPARGLVVGTDHRPIPRR